MDAVFCHSCGKSKGCDASSPGQYPLTDPSNRNNQKECLMSHIRNNRRMDLEICVFWSVKTTHITLKMGVEAG